MANRALPVAHPLEPVEPAVLAAVRTDRTVGPQHRLDPPDRRGIVEIGLVHGSIITEFQPRFNDERVWNKGCPNH